MENTKIIEESITIRLIDAIIINRYRASHLAHLSPSAARRGGRTTKENQSSKQASGAERRHSLDKCQSPSRLLNIDNIYVRL